MEVLPIVWQLIIVNVLIIVVTIIMLIMYRFRSQLFRMLT